MHNITPFSEEDKLVAVLVERLAIASGTDPPTARLIGKAAELHDVGKIRVPSHILNKPDILTRDEFKVVQTHTIWGANMLLRLQGTFGAVAREICLWHHEKFNKNGYWRKSLDDLPFYVPMVTVCDVYVALTASNRPYKQPWSHNQALEYIEREAGKQFCPKLTKTFLALMADGG